jgi:hypothetical protein
MAIRSETGLPPLAHANALAAAFEYVDGADDSKDLAAFIQELTDAFESLSIDDVMRDINEDRSVSGFPEVTSVDQIEPELVERKRQYCIAVREALNRLPPKSLVDVMTTAVVATTANGTGPAPALVDDLVDMYQVETHGSLQKGKEHAQSLLTMIAAAAKSGESAVEHTVDRLEVVLRNWVKIAKPIQLSAKARGTDDELSKELAFAIRSLAIDLFNDHDMLLLSKRLNGLVGELFAPLPEVSERVAQDAGTLEQILSDRKAAEARRADWEREVSYSAEVGLLFKDRLSISPTAVTWKTMSFPPESITRVRWGGVRHSLNGIPTGTTYTIGFGDNRSEALVELRDGDIYSAFTDKLWRLVGVRLLIEMLEALKKGAELRFGEAIVRNDGVTLMKHKLFGANEPVPLRWAQVHVWSADGAFHIGSQTDKKTHVGLSYIYNAQTHVLEHAIRTAFKKAGAGKLSDILK